MPAGVEVLSVSTTAPLPWQVWPIFGLWVAGWLYCEKHHRRRPRSKPPTDRVELVPDPARH